MIAGAIDRRAFLESAVATTLLPSLADSASTTTPPCNVLFVLADQWRFSAFGHETDPLVRTPHFDRLAYEGARWTRAYAANPVCTPNRSCILTGRYSHQHGMIQNNLMLPPVERCVAESFADAGYRTHYIGKWHMDGPAKPGFVPKGWRRRGFQTFEGFNRGHFYSNSPTFSDDGEPLKLDGFEPTRQTDLAIQFMRRNQRSPFFCYLSWGPPHTPYRPPVGFDRFSKMPQLEWRPNVPKKLRQSPKLKRELSGYYGLCEALDHEMGRLLSALDELGLSKNTLLVFTSDHGDMHGSHGKYRKGRPEEESLHVPLFMRFADRIQAGQQPDVLANSIDLMPTMLSVAGLSIPKSCAGRDLAPAVTGGRALSAEGLYSQGKMSSRQEWRSLVTREHKIAVAGGNVTHLFDLQNDPYEQKNLADERSANNLRKHLLAALKNHGRDVGDPYPNQTKRAKTNYSDQEAARARG